MNRTQFEREFRSGSDGARRGFARVASVVSFHFNLFPWRTRSSKAPSASRMMVQTVLLPFGSLLFFGLSETVSLLKWSFSFPEFNPFFLSFCLLENKREASGKWCPVELFRFCPLGGGSAQFSIFVPELEQNQPLKQFCLFHFEHFFRLIRISRQHMDC